MGFLPTKLINIFNKSQTMTQVLPEFNSVGNRILSRSILPPKSSLFYEFRAPLGTTSAEKLVVEKNFGEQSVEIITFKNAKGNIVGRLRQNYNQGKLQGSTESRYTFLKKGRDEYEKMNYGIADIQRQFYDADKNLVKMKRFKQDITIFDDFPDEKHLTQMTYEAEKNSHGIFDGVFSVSHKVSGKTDKKLSLEVQHSKDGKTLSQNVTSQVNLTNNVLKDPYLVTRAMPDEFAIKNLLEVFKQRVGLENTKINLSYIRGNDINYYLGLALDNRQICIATIPTLNETVDTVAHELRHFKQDELANKFFKQLWYKITGSKNYNPHEYKLAKKFFKFNLCYNPFPVTEFSNRFMIAWYRYGKEADALRYAGRYKKEFNRYSEQLGKEFPLTSEYFLGNESFVKYLRFVSPDSKWALS